jgi:Iap family predicted aminopeptidase
METTDYLRRHLHYLVEDIGERLAGGPGEARAADYIAAELHAAGAHVTRESFPVARRAIQQEELELHHGGAWHRVPVSTFANSPDTRGAWIEAPLVVFAGPTDYARDDLETRLRGKVVLHLGTHIESRDDYRRLIAARPAALLMVDVRFPGDTPLADALFPAYVATCGAVPTLNLPYEAAWEAQIQRADRARLRIAGAPVAATSANIIGEWLGADPTAPPLYLGCHHDTQAGSPGADDNGSGVAVMLELARRLAPLPRRRPLRCIAFGAEEQLSVGSAAYVRAHRAELTAPGGLMLNLDSIGSVLGWNVIWGTAAPRVLEELTRHLTPLGLACRREPGVVPYADHFPFLAAGVPALTLFRQNCAGGRFFHHRPDDDLGRVDLALLAAWVEGLGSLLATWLDTDQAPPAWQPTAAETTAITRCWVDLFGGW